MADNWQQKPEYKTDVEQANRQVGFVNALSRLQNGFRGTPIGAALSAGKTDFENHKLNAMLDLVHHANPEHLETASKVLWDARTAIHDAATDLETHLKGVDWEGEGAEQFRSWTDGLIAWTKGLATFADVAATEISTAATGLASVRSSMPKERDPRPAHEQKLPTELPKAKQVDSNPDYATALKVEKNRQEAINQMNRLASFYSVSATALGMALETDPKPYTPIPDVGVPRPTGLEKPVPSGSSRPASLGGGVRTSHGSITGSHAEPATSTGTGGSGHVLPLKEVHEPGTPTSHEVGTEINTTTTLPAQAPAAPPSTPVPTVPSTTGGGPLPPLPAGPMAPPVAPTAGRTPGYGPSGRLPVSAQGRTGPSGTGSGRVTQGPVGQQGRAVSSGRVPQGPLGQAGRQVVGGRAPQSPMGQAARATGRATPAAQPGARGAAQSGRAPVGRPVTGGTPRTTNAPGGRTAATGPAGPARNGVVGGKPVTGRTPGGAANTRVPRGTVVGAEEPVSSTPARGALGQRGVVGSATAKAEPGAGQAVLRSAANPQGAIGAPRSNAGSSLKGSEAGATGLGRGAVGGRQATTGEDGRAGGSARTEQRRPSQQRRDVPQKSD